MHSPLILKDISLTFGPKRCFSNFSATVSYGARIAIIGNNGVGKSSLLKILAGLRPPCEGSYDVPRDLNAGFLPQVVSDFTQKSGGERVNKALSQALALDPNCLLLDEPTNHLDQYNRRNFLQFLHNFHHTLIIASHDIDLIGNFADTIWHIDDGNIHIFNGSYENYQREYQHRYFRLFKRIEELNKKKMANHQALMKEQTRAKASRAMGEKNIKQRKYPTIVSSTKARRAEQTSGRLTSALSERKAELILELASLKAPEPIKAKFYIKNPRLSEQTILSISGASIGYEKLVATDINFSLLSCEHMAIVGDNGSGKTTLIKAILGNNELRKSGHWQVPRREHIGYLDQHYETLSPSKSPLELLREQRPEWSLVEIRKHLNNFLFRKNEEVNNKVNNLSGGEKARLSLALIASITPRLLILDEITNNLDLESKTHVVEILKNYPGAMLVVSHEQKFLDDIKIKNYYAL